MICPHWLLLMFFNYIRDTFGNTFVNTKPSRILPLVTLHESRPSSLLISCRSKGSGRELCVLGPGPYLFFSFCPRVNIPHSLPSGEMETSLFNWENIRQNKGTALPGVRHQTLLATRERKVTQNPAPTSLVWAWAAETGSREVGIQILSQISGEQQ